MPAGSRAVLLAAALACAGCASTGGGGGVPPAPTDPAALEAEVRDGFPLPERLAEGDRWFVAVRPGDGPAPFAVRRRRRGAGDLVREEVAWGRSFSEVAGARHGVVQVVGVILGPTGIGVAALDGDDRPLGEPAIEVPAPAKPGTAWEVPATPHARAIAGLVERVEEVETPAGTQRALRVSHRATDGEVVVATSWYDRGLRPVRLEIRKSGVLVEAHAALGSAEPSADDCRAAIEWAKKHFAK